MKHLSRSMLSFVFAALLTGVVRATQEPAAGPGAVRIVRDARANEYDAIDGRVRVPENRAHPERRTIEIAYVRVHARASTGSARPPIVFLNGGPGQSSTQVADDPDSLDAWQPLLDQADVVFVDQRGVGRSTPSLGLAFDESLPERFFADRKVALDYFLDGQRRCEEHFTAQGIDLAAYNAFENADDIDALRAALGVERIDLVGYSYGTLLAQTVLRRHGEHVRRAVLVGTEGAEDWGSLPTLLQLQIQKISRLAAGDPGVNHAVPDFAAQLERVLTRLEREPLDVEVEDRRTGKLVTLPLGRFGLEFLLRIDLGDGNDIPLFPALVWTLEQGRSDVVRGLVDKRYNQLAQGASAMAGAMRASYGPTPWLEARFDAEQDACILRDVCNYFDRDLKHVWSVPVLGAGFQEPFLCSVPTLFVSGTLDSNAPPYQAERIRYGFLESTHLVVDNAGHEDMLPDPGVREVMRRFFAGDDVRDARVALPRLRFVSIRKKT